MIFNKAQPTIFSIWKWRVIVNVWKINNFYGVFPTAEKMVRVSFKDIRSSLMKWY